MGQAELLIAGLLVAVAGLSALARRLSVPYPIVLVVGGALLGFVPGLPEVKLDPEVVLVVFLPPLLYGSSIYANFGDLRANLRALTLSTVGLVLATMCAVAWAAHALIPCPGKRPSFSGRSSRRPTHSRRRPSCAASKPRGAWSAASRARASSTTPPHSWPTASRSPLSWPGASRSPTPAWSSSLGLPAAWRSGSRSGGSSQRSASARPTLR